MASSISSTQSPAVSQLSQVESRPVESGEPEPNEPARPQLGSAAQRRHRRRIPAAAKTSTSSRKTGRVRRVA
jgi:hypothetical protein